MFGLFELDAFAHFAQNRKPFCNVGALLKNHSRVWGVWGLCYTMILLRSPKILREAGFWSFEPVSEAGGGRGGGKENLLH